MLFFVEHVRDTRDLQECIIRWLRQRGQSSRVANIVWIYHGQLSPDSRAAIEERFEKGDIQILVSTVAYAVGVNPPGVKYVIQWGRCSLEDALQKLGRAARGGLDDGEHGVFFWLPEQKVI